MLEEDVPKSTESDPKALIREINELKRVNQNLKRDLWKLEKKPTTLVSAVLLSIGLFCLVFSTLHSSLPLSFIGLSLTFWGGLLLYIKPTKYVKEKLLDQTATSSLVTINQLLKRLNINGKAVYLPPKYLKDLKDGQVFLSNEKNIIIPPINDPVQETSLHNNPEALYLTAPGLSLANLYEDELKETFIRADLKYLQDNLRKLFVEDLEIAEDLEVEVRDNRVRVLIKGCIYKDLHEEIEKLESTHQSLGCPLCSSLAIAISRTTGKPVIIDENKTSPDDNTIEVHYLILEG